MSDKIEVILKAGYVLSRGFLSVQIHTTRWRVYAIWNGGRSAIKSGQS